jgi:hypothetical protein
MNRTPAWLLFGVLSACASANEHDVTSAGPKGPTSASVVGARSEPKAASSARPTKRAVEAPASASVVGARSEPKAACSARPTKRFVEPLPVEPLPSSCVEGEVRDYGCNTCYCSDDSWACTELFCYEIPGGDGLDELYDTPDDCTD